MRGGNYITERRMKEHSKQEGGEKGLNKEREEIKTGRK